MTASSTPSAKRKVSGPRELHLQDHFAPDCGVEGPGRLPRGPDDLRLLLRLPHRVVVRAKPNIHHPS
eukprot:4484355-Alexandrium_andersonii.AAC.1